MANWRRNKNPRNTCSGLRGYVEVAPADVVRVFGQPRTCDGYKVSGELSFTSDHGVTLHIYDWKCTSLYSRDECTPEEFWASNTPYGFHIGGGDVSQSTLDEFSAWLKEKCNPKPPTRVKA